MKTPSSRRPALVLLALLAWAGAARAQDASTGIVADRLRPGLGPTTLAAVEGADTTPAGGLWTMLALGYLRDPIVLRAVDGSLVSRPVRAQLTGSFGFEVGLPRGFALRASVPVELVNDGDRLRGTGIDAHGDDPGPALVSAAGDLSFGVKVGIVGAPSLPGLHAALALEGTAPLGGQGQFAATVGPTVGPRLMIDFRLPWLTLAVDLGARFAKQRKLFEATFGDELVLSGGALGHLAALGRAARWHLLAYVEAQGIVASDPAARPVEVRGALRLSREGGIDIDLGGGAGVVDAVGAPRFRVFALLRAPLYRPR